MSVLAVSCLIFGIGLYGVLVRRDVIAVLISIEVMLGGPLVLFVGLAAHAAQLDGGSMQGIGLLVVVVIAAEAAVGLALLVALARRRSSTRIDELTEVKG